MGGGAAARLVPGDNGGGRRGSPRRRACRGRLPDHPGRGEPDGAPHAGHRHARAVDDWPEDTWLVFDDYQFAMEAMAPERFVDVLLRKSPVRLLLTSRKRPTWASARRLLYGEVYELGRNELAMDHEEAAAVLAHRKDAPAAGLVALAEGWPAVIGLAALTEEFELPEGSLPDALYEYFAEELYQATSPQVQRGLCRLALAPSLGEGVAEFLLGPVTTEVIGEGVRLGFLTARSGTLEFHPLLRTSLDAKSREMPAANEAHAARLARRLAELALWDDAFTLVERCFSEHLFASLLESGLPALLEEARLSTLAHWLQLAESRKLDVPIIDLAGAEIAFHEAKRPRAEALALRATRRLNDEHPMLSRAFYIAGASAHMDFHNERAKTYFEQALDAAVTIADKREAVWGELTVSLDLDLPDVTDLFNHLVGLDDGSADSEVRLAVARFITAIRGGGPLRDIIETFDSAEQLLPRITEPHMVSSFRTTHAYLLALLGRYSDALSEATRSERYARDVRLPFVVGYARRVRAISELGLRHFSRCKLLLDWLDREAEECGDIFLELEARLTRSRLLIAQGLAGAAEVLQDPPRRFPFEGERGEYLATLALARACSQDPTSALQLADEAQAISRTVEVRTLCPCIRAVVAVHNRSPDASRCAVEALQTVLEVGTVDSFVVAYRGHPELLAILARNPTFREPLAQIIENASDWALAKTSGLAASKAKRPRGTPLSHREEEVLGLIAQGLTNKEIAGTLFISEATAKVHVRHIFDKLGVRTRTEAALRASEIDGEA
jgi:DNA-binding NarL/FixJ family response regulator